MTSRATRGYKDREGGPDKVQAAERKFQRSVFWSRLMHAAFFSVAVITLAWAIPWLPYGTSVEDYNSRVGMMVFMALSASVFAFCAVRLRDQLRRVESTYETMSTVHDRLTDMRRREYFYDRLLLECDRARQDGGSFGVVVLRAHTDEAAVVDAVPVQRIVEALEPLAREYDWLAPIGAQEVAMFAPRLQESQAADFAESLRARAESALGPEDQLLAGWACYGKPATDAGDVLGQARGMAAHRGEGDSLVA